MPIRVHLDDVLSERQMTLTELADEVGITLANLSILKTGKASAAIATMRRRPTLPRANGSWARAERTTRRRFTSASHISASIITAATRTTTRLSVSSRSSLAFA